MKKAKISRFFAQVDPIGQVYGIFMLKNALRFSKGQALQLKRKEIKAWAQEKNMTI